MNFIFDYLLKEACCYSNKLRNETEKNITAFHLLHKHRRRVDYGICLQIIWIALLGDHNVSVCICLDQAILNNLTVQKSPFLIMLGIKRL